MWEIDPGRLSVAYLTHGGKVRKGPVMPDVEARLVAGWKGGGSEAEGVVIRVVLSIGSEEEEKAQVPPFRLAKHADEDMFSRSG